MADVYYRQGNTRPVLRQSLLNADGTAADITGNTGVTFRLMPENEAAPAQVSQPATVITTNPAVVEYAFATNDLNTKGIYFVEWLVAFGTNQETFPSTPNRFWLEVV